MMANGLAAVLFLWDDPPRSLRLCRGVPPLLCRASPPQVGRLA